MTSTVYYTRHEHGLTIFLDGKQSTVQGDHPSFQKILVALRNKAYKQLRSLMSLADTINQLGTVENAVRSIFVKDGAVFERAENGVETELNGALVSRILSDIGKPSGELFVEALLNFLENIRKNTRKDIREELYQFLMAGRAPITRDGCFLAYKKVKSNFKDIYTGKFDNSPGTIVRMPPEKVDTDRNQTCSTGLHFAALGYMSCYGGTSGEKIVIVKVNPRHVMAIPTDYSFQKGRSSEYYVVGLYEGGGEEAFLDAFIDEDTKEASAPKVKFAGELKPSLAALARSYGLLTNLNQVWITGPAGELKAHVVRNAPRQSRLMSFETKSVREAVKAKVEELESKNK